MNEEIKVFFGPQGRKNHHELQCTRKRSCENDVKMASFSHLIDAPHA